MYMDGPLIVLTLVECCYLFCWSVVLQTERSIFFLDWVSLLKTMLIVCSIRSFWFKKSVMLASAFDYGETGTLYV